MSAIYAIGMTISAFMLYSSLECAGNYSSLLHVVSVCVDKANTILELDTMDIDGKEIKPQNCNIKLDHFRFLMTREKSLMMYRFQFLKRQQQQLLVHLVAVNLHCAIWTQGFGTVDEGKVTLGGVKCEGLQHEQSDEQFFLCISDSIFVCRYRLKIISNLVVRMQHTRKL